MVGVVFATPGVGFSRTLGRFDIEQTRPTLSTARTRPTTLYGMPRRAVRVAILGINYAPELTGIAPYTTGLAAGLAKRAHDVCVLTGYPHYPQWKRDDASSGFRSDEEIDGVWVHRFNHYVPPHLSWVGRAAMELTFGLQLLTTRWGGPEVVVCVTPPLLAVAMAAVRARLTWRRPAVGILVHDLYSRGVAETAAVSGLSARAGVGGIGGHPAGRRCGGDSFGVHNRPRPPSWCRSAGVSVRFGIGPMSIHRIRRPVRRFERARLGCG